MQDQNQQYYANTNGAGTVPPAPAPYIPPTSNRSKLPLVIALIVSILVALTFIALFVWKYVDWQKASTNLDAQIAQASAEAVDENTTILTKQCDEEKQNPNDTFAGPADYGGLSFQYPKTWSVYEAKDAANGGDYEAYLNPDVVPPVANDTIFALRVSITDDTLEKTLEKYNSRLKNGEMTSSSRQINGENATVFKGALPNKLRGAIAVFKIRDKTVTLETDAETFLDNFENILNSVTYSK